jgi:hypothetical protein
MHRLFFGLNQDPAADYNPYASSGFSWNIVFDDLRGPWIGS